MKKNRVMACLCAVLIVAAAGIGFADNLKAAITGTFVGQTYAYTNLTGARLQLTFVGVNGTFSASTNSYVKVTQKSQTYYLYSAGAAESLYWNGEGTTLERNGVLSFFVSSSAVATNGYRIESK